MTKVTWETPAWDNEVKDKILAIKIVVDEDTGKQTKTTIQISKYDSDKKVNADWTDILTTHGINTVEENTKKRMAFRAEKKNKEHRANQERAKAKELERLFNSKLACFEIEEIKNSTNRPLRSKIRKAKNEIELMVYTSLLVMKEFENEQKETSA